MPVLLVQHMTHTCGAKSEREREKGKTELLFDQFGLLLQFCYYYYIGFYGIVEVQSIHLFFFSLTPSANRQCGKLISQDDDSSESVRYRKDVMSTLCSTQFLLTKYQLCAVLYIKCCSFKDIF